MNASKDDHKGVGADMVKIKKEPAMTKSHHTGSSKKNPITLNDSASESSDDNNYKDGGDEDDEESNSDDKVNRNNNGMRYEDSNNHKYEHNEDESDGIESHNTNEGPPGVNRQTATDFDENIAHGKFLTQNFDSVFYEGEEFNDGGSLGSGFNNDDGINNHGGSNDDVRGRIEIPMIRKRKGEEGRTRETTVKAIQVVLLMPRAGIEALQEVSSFVEMELTTVSHDMTIYASVPRSLQQ